MNKKRFADGTIHFRPTERDRHFINSTAEQAGVSRSDVLRALVRAASEKRLTIALVPQKQAEAVQRV